MQKAFSIDPTSRRHRGRTFKSLSSMHAFVSICFLATWTIHSQAFPLLSYSRTTSSWWFPSQLRLQIKHTRTHAFWTPVSTTLCMAKGDGKNKRSKQNKSSPQPTSTSSSPQPTPLRVKSDINIPVRHQIEMARQKKAHQSASVSFRQTKRTAYRKLLDDEEKEEKALQRKRRGQDPDWDVILSRNRTSPLVIVDGYNIINNWPRLKKHMKKGDTARARQMLVDDLETLRTMKGWRIEVVFDGAGRNTVGPLGQNGGNRINQADREVTKSVTKYGVRVVYSGVGTEADTYIEARAFQALNVTAGKTTSSFIIASDDTMIRMAGHEAGAVCMGADRFVSELKALKSSVSHRVEVAVATLNGHAIRPESLRGTTIIPFNRGSFYLVDKRNRTKKQV